MTPLIRPVARRLPTAVRAGVLVVLTAACGLQQAGLDGSVTVAGGPARQGTTTGDAGSTGVTGATGGLPSSAPGTTGGGRLPGTTTGGGYDATTGGATGATAGSAATGTTGSTGGTRALHGTITVSYVNVTGFEQLGKVVVVNTASTGDARAQADAVAQYVNAHGGIAGRRLVAKVHDYNAQQASETNDNNLCQSITQDDKAFLAVLQGQIHYSARNCYAAKKTLAFEGGAYGFGKAFYEAHSPYLWSPSYPDYDQVARALVATVKGKSWLKGETKVGLVLWDDAPYHEVADKTLVPALKKLGVDVVQASVSNADIGSIEDGIHAAAQTMVVNQVDHLLFLGSAPLQPFFVQQNQQYSQFVYALTTFDVPRYMAENFPKNMAGALGVGVSPVDDVVDAQYPFPQPGLETTCRNIYRAAGMSLAGRYRPGVFNSKQAMSYCESTLLLKQVADAVPGPLTSASWAAQAEQLGRRYQAAQTFVTSFGPHKHTGADAYRELAFDGSCGCMVYTSGRKTLP